MKRKIAYMWDIKLYCLIKVTEFPKESTAFMYKSDILSRI